MIRWFRGDISNELGEYLPDGEDELIQESETIRARNREQAELKCKETAKEYGGINAEVEETTQKGFWNCKFQLWG